MLPDGAELDNNCDGAEKLKVAAIINWFGISDVADLVQGCNQRNYAAMWMGSQPDPLTIAKRVSPLNYVRAGLPPILSIHGDADLVVPHEHSTRLHQALSDAGVPNELVTIKGGGPRSVYGRRTGRCLSADPGFPALPWPASVGLTAALAALNLDFLIAVPSIVIPANDESVLRLPDIFDLGPLGRRRM
jgi:acetyl esterase/lipase